MGQDHGIVDQELMNGRVTREMTEARKEERRVRKAANPIGTKGKGKNKSNGKSGTRSCHDCGEQGHIGVLCPYNWANSMIKHHRGRASLKEIPLKNSRALRLLTKEESRAGLRG